MRLHTNLHDWRSCHEALTRAKAAGRIPEHLEFTDCTEYRSTKRKRGIEIKLGTYQKVRGDGRRWSNSGNRGANSEANYGTGVHAATWDEWGWLLAELFAVDPDAICDRYVGRAGFETLTRHAYIPSHPVVSECQRAG